MNVFIWFGKSADLAVFVLFLSCELFNYDDLSFHMCWQVQAEKVEKALNLFILFKSVRPVYQISLCDRSCMYWTGRYTSRGHFMPNQ